MEDHKLREKCNIIIERMRATFFENKKCIAAYLLGSMSHDVIWEWSDIQLAVVFDDGYKGKSYYKLIEDDMFVALGVYTLTSFKDFISKIDLDNFLWKAFSKSTTLFSKDIVLDDLLEDAFYIGDREREESMLLSFSGAVYYLNKAEKNLYIKKDLDNVIYFIPQIVENIACIEIMKGKQIFERELIPQGKRLNPELFKEIYDPLFGGALEEPVLKTILTSCVEYLESNTDMVYQPVISHLQKYGNLEYFKYLTKPHGFGLNYDWLVRVGIAERYGIPETISFFKEPVYKLDYQLTKD